MERKYSDFMIRIWGKDIKRAEDLISGEIQTESIESGYFISLDPEDFLDLCAGTWHEA